MKPRLAKPLFLLLLLFVSLLSLTGCASIAQDLPDNGKGGPSNLEDKMGSGVAVEVITTIFPLADIVDNLGGGRVRVIALLPPGASPHTYEPTVEQAKAVAGADLFVFVGGGVDNWVINLAEAENIEALEITANMEKYLLEYNPLYLVDDGDKGGRIDDDTCDRGGNPETKGGTGSLGHGHNHSSFDPHVWVDPFLVKEVIAPLITERLKTIDPEGAAHYDKTLEKYQEELGKLHQEVIASTGGFTKRQFISYHSAWNYFARRYGLEEIAAVEPFPGQEPSARWLAQLVRLAEKYQIDVLFAEPQLSPKAAQVLAEEIKGRVLILDPLGGRGISGRECYTDLIRYNLEVFRMALE
jgi:ABC-type Zn uptake system ZnuABC Zn-binding protein ZnuA